MMRTAVLVLAIASMTGAQTALAQTAQADTRPAYYISEYSITNREGMKPYSLQVESTFKPYTGRYIVRGGSVVSMEGTPVTGGIVIIQFDSLELAKAWYNSPEYLKIRPIRQAASTSHVFTVEGLPK
jgi:uncharacterized protein (DUF1330 family)